MGCSGCPVTLMLTLVPGLQNTQWWWLLSQGNDSYSPSMSVGLGSSWRIGASSKYALPCRSCLPTSGLPGAPIANERMDR